MEKYVYPELRAALERIIADEGSVIFVAEKEISV